MSVLWKIAGLLLILDGVWGAELRFSHARQSKGEGYTGPKVHFAKEAIDDDPTTYSCTQNKQDSWIELYFDAPVLPVWVRFSLKPTSTYTLPAHLVELYNGAFKVGHCQLAPDQHKWYCSNPYTLATSMRVSHAGGPLEIAQIMVHGEYLPNEYFEQKAVCEDPDSCRTNPFMWDLEHQGIEIAIPQDSAGWHKVDFLGSALVDVGDFRWSWESSEFNTDGSCFEGDGDGATYPKQQTVSILKNTTHVTLARDMKVSSVFDLRAARECGPDFVGLGNVVACLKMAQNLQNAKYRPAVLDGGCPSRFNNSDWVNMTIGKYYPFQLEKSGLYYRGSGRVTIELYHEGKDGQPSVFLDHIKIDEQLTMNSCDREDTEPISGTININEIAIWEIQKNETHLQVYWNEKLVGTFSFLDNARQACKLNNGGNVVDAVIFKDPMDPFNIEKANFKTARRTRAEDLRDVLTSAVTGTPDYFKLEKYGLVWHWNNDVAVQTIDFFGLEDTWLFQIGFDQEQGLFLSLDCDWRFSNLTLDLQDNDYLQALLTSTDLSSWHWRLVKTPELLCLLLNGTVMLEADLVTCDGGMLEGDVVRGVRFTPPAPYRRTNSDFELEIANLPAPDETVEIVCPAGARNITLQDGSDGCEVCALGYYGKDGRECMQCPEDMVTSLVGAQDVSQCQQQDSTTCSCRINQYCDENGTCHDQSFVAGGHRSRPGSHLLILAMGLISYILPDMILGVVEML